MQFFPIFKIGGHYLQPASLIFYNLLSTTRKSSGLTIIRAGSSSDKLCQLFQVSLFFQSNRGAVKLPSNLQIAPLLNSTYQPPISEEYREIKTFELQSSGTLHPRQKQIIDRILGLLIVETILAKISPPLFPRDLIAPAIRFLFMLEFFSKSRSRYGASDLEARTPNLEIALIAFVTSM